MVHRERVVFMGTGEIGLPALRYLVDLSGTEVCAVFTQPDKPAGRGMELRASPIKELAVARGIPVFQPPKLRNLDAVASVAALKPRMIVVMAYGQILPQAILDLPPLGCINLHASILPRWRGAAPIQAAIDAGDSVTGVTVMVMDAGLDTGDVVWIEETPIPNQMTGGTLHDRLGLVAASALANAFPLLVAGTAKRIPQDSALATHAPKLDRDSGVIDWNRSAEQIARRIRAYDPWPGSSTVIPTRDGARTLRVHRARSLNRVSPGAGQTWLEREDGTQWLVGTGDGVIELLDVQLEGRKRMAADEFLRGFIPTHGTPNKLGVLL
jgi:methionyl-tRNA formyltransferase